MRFDLHTHSHCSDGTLSPRDLVVLAASRGVQMLALTDHDTLAGLGAAAAECARLGLAFVGGVELSANWRGRTVHVLGLGVLAGHEGLERHAAAIRVQRRERISEIASRLERKRGLPVRALVAELLSAAPVPTRTHLARALSAAGHAKNTGEAFERLLGRGRPGYVPAQWPALGDSLSQIRTAGGYPVLAHPHRYGLGARVFSELIGEFAAGGGAALEISSAGVSPNDRDRIATQARRWRLAGSGGSDFHDPAVPWNSPGRFAKLPQDIEPIAARFFGTAGTHDRER